MRDSGSDSKMMAGLRYGYGLSAHGLFVDNVPVLQKMSKVRAIFCAFRRIWEDEKARLSSSTDGVSAGSSLWYAKSGNLEAYHGSLRGRDLYVCGIRQ